MIVPMKKVSLVVLDSSREQSLEELRNAGVLHLEIGEGSSGELEGLYEKQARLDLAFRLIPASKKKERQEQGNFEKSIQVADGIIDLCERGETIEDELRRLQREKDRLSEWGDFDPAEIGKLEKQGICLTLRKCSREELSAFPDTVSVQILSERKASVAVAVVSVGDTGELPGDEFIPPELGLSQIQSKFDKYTGQREDIRKQLLEMNRFESLLKKGLAELEGLTEFERARLGMGTSGPLAFITGYAPEDAVEGIATLVSEHGWAALTEEPAEDDPVPTLVRSPKWIGIIHPIFSLLGIAPGYREYDISFWFLLFFSGFFAMIVGDAGYGLLFLIMTITARFLIKKAPGEAFFLLYVLSICTIVWGSLTGTWFGAKVLVSAGSPLSRFVVGSIASFPKDGIDSGEILKRVCFLIGAVQISIAHIKNFLRSVKKGIEALSELGWLFIVWGMFCFVGIIVMRNDASAPIADWLPGVSVGTVGIILVAAGMGLVVFFGEQSGNFFKGLLVGLAKFPLKILDAISCFSDIISYVRLFAVGLATVKVAESFNEMASGIGFAFPGAVFAALILFLGHGLNIIMSAMSIIVHGVRLNVLEFSNHLNMEWSGIAYNPFRTKIAEETENSEP